MIFHRPYHLRQYPPERGGYTHPLATFAIVAALAIAIGLVLFVVLAALLVVPVHWS